MINWVPNHTLEDNFCSPGDILKFSYGMRSCTVSSTSQKNTFRVRPASDPVRYHKHTSAYVVDHRAEWVENIFNERRLTYFVTLMTNTGQVGEFFIDTSVSKILKTGFVQTS